MSEYLSILLLATLPALGNFAGGILSEFVTFSQRNLSMALHAAAGILIAVVGVEILPAAIKLQPTWVIILSFFVGGVFFILIDSVQDHLQEKGGNSESGSWAIFLGVMVDLFGDGLLIGSGSAISSSLGLFLALAQVTADIPEGFASMGTFKSEGFSRRSRILLAASFTLPVLFSATFGYWLLRGQSELLKYAILTFTAGMLTSITVEEIMPMAHRGKESRLAMLCFLLGFTVFTTLSVYLK